MLTFIAQNVSNLGNIEGLGPLGNTSTYMGSDVSPATALFNRVISTVVGFLTVVAGLYFVFQFIIGAIGWLTAGGSQDKIKDAQTKITNSVIGMVIVIAAIFIIDLIGMLLGLDILSPGKFIANIWT